MKLLLFLLAPFVGGAIINVAVAWGCSRFATLKGQSKNIISESDVSFIESAGESCATDDLEAMQGFGLQGRVMMLSDPVQYQRIQEYQESSADLVNVIPRPAWVKIQESGWPFSALSCAYWRHTDTYTLRNSCSVNEIELAIPIGSSRGSLSQQFLPWIPQKMLPMRTVWPGFAINSVFYGAILWMMLALPGFIKRRWRIKRGLCAWCAYDLRGRGDTGQECQECGSR